MGNAKDTPREYLRPYEEAAAQHGPTFDALLWRNREFQTLRFDALAREVGLAGRAIADLGCGMGDLPHRLVENGWTPRTYVGVEGVAALAERARSHVASLGIERAEIVGADFVADAGLFERLVRDHGVEIMVFSGSLNTLGERLARRTLHRAWRSVERIPGGALAFNFLSDAFRDARADGQGPAHRFSTRRLAAWALERADRVTLRTEYLGGHDALLVMHAPEPRAT